MNAAIDRAGVQALAAELKAITSRPWTLMEVCGGQTHAIVRWGLDQLLPPGTVSYTHLTLPTNREV